QHPLRRVSRPAIQAPTTTTPRTQATPQSHHKTAAFPRALLRAAAAHSDLVFGTTPPAPATGPANPFQRNTNRPDRLTKTSNVPDRSDDRKRNPTTHSAVIPEGVGRSVSSP